MGDAFGAPLEGAPPSAVAHFVERRARSSVPWRYTDDGAMVLAYAEALLASRTIEPPVLLHAIARYYEPARGFGRGMKLAITAFANGTPWERCAFAAWPEGSRGNGAAVRMPALAFARWPLPADFDLAVRLATRITHAHPDALGCAQLQALALGAVLQSPELVQEPLAFRAHLQARLTLANRAVTDKVDLVFALLEDGASSAEAGRRLGTSTLATESTCAALWSFLAQHASFERAITSAALLGGDVDSICSMVGALAGALHGASAIEPRWLENLTHERPRPVAIVQLADALHAIEPISPRTSWLPSE